MATNESWETRRKILDCLFYMKKALDKYARVFAELEAVKTTVLDDPVKKADLKLLLDQDPALPMTKVISEYQHYKAINDWLETQ